MDLDSIMLEGRLPCHRFPHMSYYGLAKHHVKGCKSRWKNAFKGETYGLMAIGYYEEPYEECTM